MMSLSRISLIAATFALATPSLAFDGGLAAQGEETTYYEQMAAGEALTPASTADQAASGGLPTELFVVEAEGGVRYRDLGDGSWAVDVEVAPRPHERVDAVYDLVLALPLPLGSKSDAWRITPRLSSRAGAAQFVYGGESVVLKRNVPLEAAWLPLLAGAPDGLPHLSSSDYVWTFWDAIVRYDASAGSTLQAFGSFRYEAESWVQALDSEDPRNAAYVITWVPTLDAVPPFAIRLDVLAPAKE